MKKRSKTPCADGIAANFSYEMIPFDRQDFGVYGTDFTGINVHNAERVRQLAHDRRNHVYVPLSPQPYGLLLLSYVLYHRDWFRRTLPPVLTAISGPLWPGFPSSGRVLYSSHL